MVYLPMAYRVENTDEVTFKIQGLFKTCAKHVGVDRFPGDCQNDVCRGASGGLGQNHAICKGIKKKSS